MDYSFERVVILGGGQSGLSAKNFVEKKGGRCVLFDDKIEGASLLDGERFIRQERASLCVLSPGISINHPTVLRAKEVGISVISEFDLGLLDFKGKIVAVTGTNGKTTTVSLIGEILKEGGIDCVLGGNIGVPTTSIESKASVGVFEVSSFMLEGEVAFKPDIAVILNALPDHIARHGSFENYVDAKRKIYKNCAKQDYLVQNYDDELLRRCDFVGKRVWFSKKESTNGAYLEGGNILFGKGEYVTGLYSLKKMGVHNLENALAAITVGKILNVPDLAIERAIKNFKGISHRIEFVRKVDGVCYYDDSKGTNPNSTLFACNALEESTVLILGGVDKGCDFDELFAKLPSSVKEIIALGEAKEKILQSAKRRGYKNITLAGTFKEGVLLARVMAKKGWNVLLSPACASFDMFKNYEERGEAYASIVNEF